MTHYVVYGPAVRVSGTRLTIDSLGCAYLGQDAHTSSGALQGELGEILSKCPEAQAGIAIVWFAFHPGGDPTQNVIAHYLYSRDHAIPSGTSTLRGGSPVRMIYLSSGGGAVGSQVLVSTSESSTGATLGAFVSSISAAALGTLSTFNQSMGSSAPADTTLFWRVSEPIVLDAKNAAVTTTDYVAASPAIAPGTFAFGTAQRTWLLLDAGATGFVGKERGARRAKIDSKTYASDPLPIGMASAGLEFHLPYESWSPRPSPRERIGVALRVGLTPSLSVGAGPTIGIVRGFGLTAGYSYLWVSTTPSGKHLGDSVTTGPNPQLVTLPMRVWFAGLTYTPK